MHSKLPALALTVLGMLAVSACGEPSKDWTGWVYPDREDLTKSEPLPHFATFEDCQDAAIGKLRSYTVPDAADYECGYQCRFDPALQINVCKETRK